MDEETVLDAPERGKNESWSSGYGMKQMFQRSWVQIPAPYTGWTFFHIPIVV